ncbi:uncharacterized protein LOC128233916 [Mya arenaria]|uniref:uncharacterized protein LOC128233916 n=1 Tax=Mya arenaria TaxID=6604 RepID=UPI0022E90184|nr:uncharacterized protein LOC128233916 [Mya arenaria]XP_052803766.1 uncharacterized protein LOC128233916 [Mya arenaria]XP_052803773.1 uncharacterized protein LOC128233916 [Mya arenaria]XP_052803782.1 uncharacterized protein LOC128233916 [Mya arenaria]
MSLTKQECEAFWSKADKNGDGKLTIQELDQGLRSILPPGKGPSSKDVVYMFSAVDKDGDKTITKKEFFDEMEKPPRRKALEETFKRYDKDNSGTLTRDEIEAVVRDSGSFSKGCDVKKVADAIMEEADTSGDGAIDLKEFLKVVS